MLPCSSILLDVIYLMFTMLIPNVTVVLLVLQVFLKVKVSGQISNPSTCAEPSVKRVTIPLGNCQTGMIHVKQELAGAANATCTVREDECTTVRADTASGLTVNCNGRSGNCEETIPVPTETCNASRYAIGVSYECIADSHDLCSMTDQQKEEPVYLHSPGFPGSRGVSGLCSCNITGSDVIVEILELYSQHVLNISADGVQVWPQPGELPSQYNTDVVGPGQTVERADSVTVTYAGLDNIVIQDVWVKISGGGSMTVKCFGADNDTRTTPEPSTVQDFSTSTTNTSPVTSGFSSYEPDFIPSTTSTSPVTSGSSTNEPDFITSTTSTSPVTSGSSTNEPETGSTATETSDESVAPVTERSPDSGTSISNSTLIAVAALFGVTTFILLAIVLGLVYFKVWRPYRSRQSDRSHVENGDYDLPMGGHNQEIPVQPRDRNNTYSDLYQEDQTGNDYSRLDL